VLPLHYRVLTRLVYPAWPNPATLLDWRPLTLRTRPNLGRFGPRLVLAAPGGASVTLDYVVTVQNWDDEEEVYFLDTLEEGPTAVTFGPGEAAKDLTVVPDKDNEVEWWEFLGVEVTGGGSSYLVGWPGAAEVGLADDPPVVTVAVALDPDTGEPEEAAEVGRRAGHFLASRRGGDGAAPFAAGLLFAGGAAVFGEDYEVTVERYDGAAGEWVTEELVPNAAGSVPFAAGEGVKRVAVVPRRDNRVEGAETVRVSLGDGGTSYLVGYPGEATMLLHDDPPVVTIETDELYVQEGQTGEITLRRVGGNLSQALTVTLTVRADDDGATLWEPDGISEAVETGPITVTFQPNEATVIAKVAPEADMESHVARRLLVSIEDDCGNRYLAGDESEAAVVVTERPADDWEDTYWEWVEDWQTHGWLWMDGDYVLLGHPARLRCAGKSPQVC
jgi:hypothetical protein